MKIPDPYFENVLGHGDLHMEQVIVEYDYPLLSVLIDDKENRYVSICYSVMDAQRWIIAPISVPDLIGLLTNTITLDAPYKKCDTDVILALRDYKTKKETFRKIDPASIPEECLPETGEYLDAEENEWSSYVRWLRQKKSDWESVFKPEPIIANSMLNKLFVVTYPIKRSKGWDDLKISAPLRGRAVILPIGTLSEYGLMKR